MLKKTAYLYMIAGLILALSISALAQGNLSSLKCDLIMDHPSVGRTEGKLFMKGDKSRIELNTAGVPTVSIVDGQSAYIYMPQQNMAMTMDINQAKAQVPKASDYGLDCTYLGEESVDGRACGVYECSQGKQSAKIWRAKDIDFPVKVIAAGATTYYKNIFINISLDEALFSLPPGVQLQDMGQLMQGGQDLLHQGESRKDDY